MVEKENRWLVTPNFTGLASNVGIVKFYQSAHSADRWVLQWDGGDMVFTGSGEVGRIAYERLSRWLTSGEKGDLRYEGRRGFRLYKKDGSIGSE